MRRLVVAVLLQSTLAHADGLFGKEPATLPTTISAIHLGTTTAPEARRILHAGPDESRPPLPKAPSCVMDIGDLPARLDLHAYCVTDAKVSSLSTYLAERWGEPSGSCWFNARLGARAEVVGSDLVRYVRVVPLGDLIARHLDIFSSRLGQSTQATLRRSYPTISAGRIRLATNEFTDDDFTNVDLFTRRDDGSAWTPGDADPIAGFNVHFHFVCATPVGLRAQLARSFGVERRLTPSAQGDRFQYGSGQAVVELQLEQGERATLSIELARR